MKSRITPDFWDWYRGLPTNIQGKAYESYRLWRVNPAAPSLHFKRVSETEPLYSVRVGRQHRALGLLDGDTIYWYFVGNHDQYERMLRGLIG